MTGRTLALDTSARAISLALLEGDRILQEAAHNPEAAGSSRLLAPSLARLMSEQQWQFADLDSLVIPLGPGSFSGLRMGLVTAKALAYALNLPICGLNTLQVLAFRVGQTLAPGPGKEYPEKITAVLDAQRGELFAQSFRWDSDGIPQPLGPRVIIPAVDLLEHFPEGLITGSGLAVFERGRGASSGAVAVGSPPDFAGRVVSRNLWNCSAAAAGQLAARWGSGRPLQDCWELVPDYGRPSAAEEQAIDRRRRPL